MKLLKTFTLKWWQGGIFKWGVLVLGILVGTYWHDFFSNYFLILIIIAVPSLAYITYLWWKQ